MNETQSSTGNPVFRFNQNNTPNALVYRGGLIEEVPTGGRLFSVMSVATGDFPKCPKYGTMIKCSWEDVGDSANARFFMLPSSAFKSRKLSDFASAATA